MWHRGEGCPVLGFSSCELPVLFWKVTFLSFQVTCPSSCVTGLASPLIPDCFHLCHPFSCVYSPCLPLSLLPEYFLRLCLCTSNHLITVLPRHAKCSSLYFDFLFASEREWYFVCKFLVSLFRARFLFFAFCSPLLECLFFFKSS